MDLLLGLDVGTTATKAFLFDLGGRIIASASRLNRLITPQQGWVEQDPEALWQGAVEAIHAATQSLGPADRVLALAQSSQAGTTIPVDAAGDPTHNAFSWMDGRAEAECQHVRQAFGAEAVYRRTGWVLWEGLPLQHIAWFRHHCPEDFARTRRFLFVNDFVGFRLTGELCMNPSDAGITQLLNVANADWDDELLALAGARREQMSPMQLSGCVVGGLTPEAAAATGLLAGTPLINGAHDQYCAAVGLGITRPGRTMLSCGTAWVLLAVPETLEAGLRSGMRVSPHAVPGRWGALLSLGGVGASLEWVLDHVWGGADSAANRSELYVAVNEAAARSPSGAAGLLFYPLSGGHPEHMASSAGGFLGLTLGHSRDDVARAVMEGVAYELRWTLEEIRAAGVPVDGLLMAGGAARSPVWPQIVADATGLPVTLAATTEAASWGAAILAGVGAGVFPSIETGAAVAGTSAETDASASRSLAPDPGRQSCYDSVFARYKRLSQAVYGAM